MKLWTACLWWPWRCSQWNTFPYTSIDKHGSGQMMLPFVSTCSLRPFFWQHQVPHLVPRLHESPQLHFPTRNLHSQFSDCVDFQPPPQRDHGLASLAYTFTQLFVAGLLLLGQSQGSGWKPVFTSSRSTGLWKAPNTPASSVCLRALQVKHRKAALRFRL